MADDSQDQDQPAQIYSATAPNGQGVSVRWLKQPSKEDWQGYFKAKGLDKVPQGPAQGSAKFLQGVMGENRPPETNVSTVMRQAMPFAQLFPGAVSGGQEIGQGQFARGAGEVSRAVGEAALPLGIAKAPAIISKAATSPVIGGALGGIEGYRRGGLKGALEGASLGAAGGSLASRGINLAGRGVSALEALAAKKGAGEAVGAAGAGRVPGPSAPPTPQAGQASPVSRPIPPDIRKISNMQVVEGSSPNASGQTQASVEALNRQASMAKQGQRFAVVRGGQVRPLMGPEAVDYQPRPGETFGTIDANGNFSALQGSGSPAVKPKLTQQQAIDQMRGEYGGKKTDALLKKSGLPQQGTSTGKASEGTLPVGVIKKMASIPEGPEREAWLAGIKNPYQKAMLQQWRLAEKNGFDISKLKSNKGSIDTDAMIKMGVIGGIGTYAGKKLYDFVQAQKAKVSGANPFNQASDVLDQAMKNAGQR